MESFAVDVGAEVVTGAATSATTVDSVPAPGADVEPSPSPPELHANTPAIQTPRLQGQPVSGSRSSSESEVAYVSGRRIGIRSMFRASSRVPSQFETIVNRGGSRLSWAFR
jgi:hypothetical protein